MYDDVTVILQHCVWWCDTRYTKYDDVTRYDVTLYDDVTSNSNGSNIRLDTKLILPSTELILTTVDSKVPVSNTWNILNKNQTFLQIFSPTLCLPIHTTNTDTHTHTHTHTHPLTHTLTLMSEYAERVSLSPPPYTPHTHTHTYWHWCRDAQNEAKKRFICMMMWHSVWWCDTMYADVTQCIMMCRRRRKCASWSKRTSRTWSATRRYVCLCLCLPVSQCCVVFTYTHTHTHTGPCGRHAPGGRLQHEPLAAGLSLLPHSGAPQLSEGRSIFAWLVYEGPGRARVRRGGEKWFFMWIIISFKEFWFLM